MALTTQTDLSSTTTEVAIVVSTQGTPSLHGNPIVITNPASAGEVWPAALCPMAYFLVTGTDVVTLRSWNDTANDYTPQFTTGTSGSGYLYTRAVRVWIWARLCVQCVGAWDID